MCHTYWLMIDFLRIGDWGMPHELLGREGEWAGLLCCSVVGPRHRLGNPQLPCPAGFTAGLTEPTYRPTPRAPSNPPLCPLPTASSLDQSTDGWSLTRCLKHHLQFPSERKALTQILSVVLPALWIHGYSNSNILHKLGIKEIHSEHYLRFQNDQFYELNCGLALISIQ